jgi:hypothetical protein
MGLKAENLPIFALNLKQLITPSEYFFIQKTDLVSPENLVGDDVF